jgi:adenosylcobinamide-phosphate synthase
MSFLAVLLALVLEQVRPLSPTNVLHAGLRAWVRVISGNLDAGRTTHGYLAWAAAVAVPAVLAMVVHHLLWQLHPVLAYLWNVGLLYLTLGFRQFSHHFTAIRDALDVGDEDQARSALARWQQVDVGQLPRSEIVRHVIEHSVLAAHRHVFGVLSCYCIGAALGLGPAGAVLYRLSEFASRYWSHKSSQPGEGVSPALLRVAEQAWALIDYLPARMTAVAFAVVGSFEDAVDSWRQCTQSLAGLAWASVERNQAVVLAATAGAVQVRLGGSPLSGFAPNAADASDTSDVPLPQPLGSLGAGGRTPELAHLRSVVGLVWRSVVLWMVLLALLTLARLLG